MTATNICYNFVGFRCSPPLPDEPRTQLNKGNGRLGELATDTLDQSK